MAYTRCFLDRPDGARDRAGHRLLPQLAQAVEVSRAEAVEEQIADDGVVDDLCGAKAGKALRRESDEQAAPVGRVGGPLDQIDLREPVDRP